jgi:hypothetical protein
MSPIDKSSPDRSTERGPLTGRRRARLNREELRAMLLEEGREILFEDGLEAGSSNLTFKRVFERVEKKAGVRLTNASVIRRVWENQADFQADVLVAIAKDEGRQEAEGTVRAVEIVFGGLDLSTAESRARAVPEACRVGGAASSTAIAGSTSWSLWISVIAMATATTTPDQQRRIKAALKDGYTSVSRFWSEAIAGFMEFLGLRIRQPWTMAEFTMAVIAYSEGCSLRQHTSGNSELMIRPTGPDGEDQQWTLFAVGLEALVNQFLELDTEFAPTPP